MAIAITIIGLILLGGAVGSIAFGAPYVGIPLAFLFIGLIIMKEQMERQNRILRLKRWRREAANQQVDFDAGDKRTLV
jgi:hypothetical protein